MGEVYRARDARLGRDVALKILPEAFAGDPDRLMRFEREARTLASLNHPYIAHIHGLEESGATRALVMELVEGDDLSVRIALGPLALEDALAIGRQIAEALEAAHEQGIIHRDLKPANVKVRPDGTVKVLDFGLAKAVATGRESAAAETLGAATISSPAMTMRGVILGTAAYMAPEQAKGRQVDKRADIWAFGCVLYEMLAGARAFEGEDVSDTLAAVLRGEPDWAKLPDLPPAVMMLLKRCLEREARRRIGDMSTVRFVLDAPRALSSVVPTSAVDSARTDVAVAAAVAEARRRLLTRTILPLALGLAVVGVLGGMAYARRSAPASAPPVTRFNIPLPEGQVLSLSRRMMALSPDGQELAYVTDNQLYLRRLSHLDPTPLLGGGGQNLTLPTYSPDGAWLAFHSGGDGSIKRVSARGGAALRVCEAAVPLTIGWDQSGILLGLGTGGILRCDPAGGPAETLVRAGEGELMIGPQILEGGQSVLYTVAKVSDPPESRWDRAEVVVQTLPSGARRTIVNAGSDGHVVSTGHLLYRFRGILFALPFEAGSQQTVGEPVPVVEGIMRSTLGATQMAISDTGSLVYSPGPTGTDSSDRELVMGDRAGVVTRLPLPAGPFNHVRVSPDGSRVVLGSDDGKNAVVWIYALDAQSALQRLTLDGHNRFPVWSSDGQSIAYQSDRGGDAGIYRQRADGSGGAERLTTAAAGESHIPESWSPDGRHLSYAVLKQSAQGMDYELWVLAKSGGTAAPFGGVRSREPIGSVFSPDGRWIAYTTTPTDEASAPNRGIFVQPFPGTGAVFQAPRQLVDFHPMWSADAKELVFLASANARQMAAMRVSVAGGVLFGTPSRFPASVTGGRLSASPRSFDLLPDGRMIGVIARSDSGRSSYSELRVVLNWFEELKQRVPVR